MRTLTIHRRWRAPCIRHARKLALERNRPYAVLRTVRGHCVRAARATDRASNALVAIVWPSQEQAWALA